MADASAASSLPDHAHPWPAMLERALRGDGLGTHYQPIVDLARGVVVGFEGLLRMSGHPVSSPESWLTAARARGLEAAFEAAALRSALAARPALPANTFLTVNVSPDVLAHPLVREVWLEQGSLGGVVVELTENVRIDSYVELEPHLDVLRGAGAMIAIDDAGSGYAGLQHLLGLRPSFIKLDRALVAGVDRDEAKRALVEMIGTLASRIDAWLLAEGIEREAELRTLAALGVPLGQGYLLARPAPAWPTASAESVRLLTALRDQRRPDDTDTLAGLLEPAVTVSSADEGLVALGVEDTDHAVVVDGWGHPVATVDVDGLVHAVHDSALRMNVRTPVAQAAERAITRLRSDRFAPLLCTDDAGRLVGLVRMERVVAHLAATSYRGSSARS